MAVAWFFAPMKRRVPDPRPGRVERYCGMDDFSGLIQADGGDWRESECLGNQAVVKVRASAATLATVAAATGYTRVPLSALDNPTSTLAAAQRTAIVNKLQSLGYTAAEVNTAFPLGWDGPYTLRDILRFALTRRFAARYDTQTDAVVLDGNQETPDGPDTVEAAVATG